MSKVKSCDGCETCQCETTKRPKIGFDALCEFIFDEIAIGDGDDPYSLNELKQELLPYASDISGSKPVMSKRLDFWLNNIVYNIVSKTDSSVLMVTPAQLLFDLIQHDLITLKPDKANIKQLER